MNKLDLDTHTQIFLGLFYELFHMFSIALEYLLDLAKATKVSLGFLETPSYHCSGWLLESVQDFHIPSSRALLMEALERWQIEKSTHMTQHIIFCLSIFFQSFYLNFSKVYIYIYIYIIFSFLDHLDQLNF